MYSPYNVSGSASPDFTNSAADQLARAKGGAFSSLNAHRDWERCVIHAVYPDRYTCDVFTEHGRFLSGVPWPSTNGEVRAPRRGDRLGVHFNLGTPQLQMATANVATTPEYGEPFRLAPPALVGGEDPVYSERGSNNARGNMPRDVIAGDWLQVGDLGNMVGVLAGGYTVLKGGELAQVIASQARNMLKLIGQNFSVFTGAGTVDFTTLGGKTSMVMRLGADNETEADPSADNFRIRCELGDEGELVDFRVTDGKGRNVYRLHVDPDGRVENEAFRETRVIETDQLVEVGTNQVTRVGGDHLTYAGGGVLVKAGTGVGVETGGVFRVQSGGDVGLGAMHDMNQIAGRRMSTVVGGQSTGTNPALKYTVSNGNVTFDIGNPLAGDTQVRKSGFEVDTRTGNIRMESAAGVIEMNAPQRYVKIGGRAGVSPYHAVLYEELGRFFRHFGRLIDNHTHTCPAAAAPTSRPITPPWMLSRVNFTRVKSKKVKLGG